MEISIGGKQTGEHNLPLRDFFSVSKMLLDSKQLSPLHPDAHPQLKVHFCEDFQSSQGRFRVRFQRGLKG